MASLTVENYVKAIFKISVTDGHHRATTGRLATALDVSPGTVTSMLKTLSDSGLGTYTPYEGVRLTDAGTDLALRILRRHRLVELFLTKSLGLGWDEVHEDAEQMEHMVSDFLINRIDAHLGYPKFDPHGDPIPAEDGTMASHDAEALSTCEPGTQFRLVQVTEQSSDFLRYLSESGLELNAVATVTAVQPEAEVFTIKINDHEITLGHGVARSLMVTRIETPSAEKAESHG